MYFDQDFMGFWGWKRDLDLLNHIDIAVLWYSDGINLFRKSHSCNKFVKMKEGSSTQCKRDDSCSLYAPRDVEYK